MLHRIMLIDDDEDDRDFFCYALREAGYDLTVVRCATGAEALAYLSDNNNALPELIFLDINMPGLDGRETLVRIKKMERVGHLPVIIYSTSGTTAEELKSLGAARVMVKAHRLKAVVEQLAEILKVYA